MAGSKRKRDSAYGGVSIDDSKHYVEVNPNIKPKYKTREEWLRANGKKRVKR